MMDLRSLQKIPEEYDRREPEERTTPYLTRYVPLDERDPKLNPDAIAQLEKLDFDWVVATQNVLFNSLSFEIISFLHLNDEMAEDKDDRAYGITRCVLDPNISSIKCSIVGEVIWPLLVKDYSSSEKLVCSFLIASTLLHEFAVGKPPKHFSQ
jgi:hypothetical protein